MRKKARWFGALAIIVGGLVITGESAWAQGSPPAGTSADAKAQAAKLFKDAAEDAGKKKWADAYPKYRAAYDLDPLLIHLAKLIQAEIAIGRKADAAGHLVQLIKRKDELDAETAAQTAKDAQEKLADLKKDLGTATITVSLEGAEVLIDGSVVGKAPLDGDVFVEPGRRTFLARKDGFVTADQTVDVTAGSPTTVTLTLKKADGPGPSGPGPGPGKVAGPNWTLIYAGIGVSGVFAVAGIVTGIVSVTKKGQADEVAMTTCIEPCAAEREKYEGFASTAEGFGVASLVTFLGAGLTGGATLAYWVRTRNDGGASSTTPRAAVVITPSGGSFAISGRW